MSLKLNNVNNVKFRHQFRKFLQGEAELLAVLHLNYSWVKVQRRLTKMSNAFLVPKADQSQKLLMEVKSINGKQCSFHPA